MVGRVLVNNNDITASRSIQGEVEYATIGSLMVLPLKKGTNTVQPQYRTPATTTGTMQRRRPHAGAPEHRTRSPPPLISQRGPLQDSTLVAAIGRPGVCTSSNCQPPRSSCST